MRYKLTLKESGNRMLTLNRFAVLHDMVDITKLVGTSIDKIYIDTDLHLTENTIEDYIKLQKKVVSNDDIFICLGDLIYDEDSEKLRDSWYTLVNQLNGRYKFLVLGNNDILKRNFYKLKCGFDMVSLAIKLDNILFTHCPIATGNEKVFNIHGHVHKNFKVFKSDYEVIVPERRVWINCCGKNITYPKPYESTEFYKTVPITKPIKLVKILSLVKSKEFRLTESCFLEDTYPKTLYHISGDANLDKIVMKPRVPDMPIKGEDSKIKRISFSETIDGCLAGIFPIHPGTDLDDPRYTEYPNGYDFYVYTPIGDYSYTSNSEIIKRRLVPDASVSKEVWITSPVKVKKLGKIHVEPFNPKTAKTFTYIMYFKNTTKKGIGLKFKWHWIDRINLREDLGNTPKGYKDINHIIDNCNEWFEANGDKNCNICWSQHMQIKKWALELKKYRSKKGPITFERDLKKLKLKPKKR